MGGDVLYIYSSPKIFYTYIYIILYYIINIYIRIKYFESPERYNALTRKSPLWTNLSLKFRIAIQTNYNSCTLHDISVNLFKNLEIRFEQFIEV